MQNLIISRLSAHSFMGLWHPSVYPQGDEGMVISGRHRSGGKLLPGFGDPTKINQSSSIKCPLAAHNLSEILLPIFYKVKG